MAKIICDSYDARKVKISQNGVDVDLNMIRSVKVNFNINEPVSADIDILVDAVEFNDVELYFKFNNKKYKLMEIVEGEDENEK